MAFGWRNEADRGGQDENERKMEELLASGESEGRCAAARATPEPMVKLLQGEKMGWWAEAKNGKTAAAHAIVNGAINDVSARILLDSGANVRLLSAAMANKIRLKDAWEVDQALAVQGIGDEKVHATSRCQLKITLGWRVAYVFSVWIGQHNGGCDLILGTDFLQSAGIVLDLYRSRVCLPDEVIVPLANHADSHRIYMEP